MVPKLNRGCKKDLPTKEKFDLMLGFEAGVPMRKTRKLSKS